MLEGTGWPKHIGLKALPAIALADAQFAHAQFERQAAAAHLAKHQRAAVRQCQLRFTVPNQIKAGGHGRLNQVSTLLITLELNRLLVF